MEFNSNLTECKVWYYCIDGTGYKNLQVLCTNLTVECDLQLYHLISYTPTLTQVVCHYLKPIYRFFFTYLVFILATRNGNLGSGNWLLWELRG